ncbi:MAG: AbrB/MazE/SpoVT family DNA-binding domain-containing protein [Desulfarculaceae bacterium]|jgi:antitoxin MazE
MATLVSKWGHSLAVRLPRHITAQTGIREGDSVEITANADGLVVISPARPQYNLGSLVKKINSKNVHKELTWGAPQGREVW